jgi:hypothetical protein
MLLLAPRSVVDEKLWERELPAGGEVAHSLATGRYPGRSEGWWCVSEELAHLLGYVCVYACV